MRVADAVPIAPAKPAGPAFDWTAVGERLLVELYRLLAAAPLLVVALLLTLAAWWLGGWLARRALIDRLAGANPFLKNLLATTLRGGCALLGLAVGLQLMNATAIVGAVLGTAGVVGIALGFAFKDIVENYIAGVLLSLRQPFRPRDHVRIAEHEGLVTAMTARATVLMTLDGNQLRVPNAIVFKSVILNYSQNPNRRFEFDLSAPLDPDWDRAQARVQRQVQAVDGVLREPDAEVLLMSAGDGKAALRVRGWIDQRLSDIDRVRSVALRAATQALQCRSQEDVFAPSANLDDPACAPTSRPSSPERVRQRLVSWGEACTQSRDLLDPSAPAE